MSIGKQLRKLREDAGLTLYDVERASRGRVASPHLSMIERGVRHPTLHTLQLIAKALRVTITVTPRGVTVKEAS